MKLVPFLFFLSWILPAVQSQEDGGNLRASQGQMHEHLQQELDQSLRNLNEEFQGDRELFFIRASAICNRIESAFRESVDCTCAWQYFTFAFGFTCTNSRTVNLAGISGKPEYSGSIDLNPFRLGLDIDAKVCIKEVKIGSINLPNLCVDGALCLGAGGVGPCACAATFGELKCACQSCTGGVKFDCGPLIDFAFDLLLPNFCIPLPFVRTLFPPRNSIDGLESVED
jgi:hypothetical protein